MKVPSLDNTGQGLQLRIISPKIMIYQCYLCSVSKNKHFKSYSNNDGNNSIEDNSCFIAYSSTVFLGHCAFFLHRHMEHVKTCTCLHQNSFWILSNLYLLLGTHGELGPWLPSDSKGRSSPYIIAYNPYILCILSLCHLLLIIPDIM